MASVRFALENSARLARQNSNLLSGSCDDEDNERYLLSGSGDGEAPQQLASGSAAEDSDADISCAQLIDPTAMNDDESVLLAGLLTTCSKTQIPAAQINFYSDKMIKLTHTLRKDSTQANCYYVLGERVQAAVVGGKYGDGAIATIHTVLGYVSLSSSEKSRFDEYINLTLHTTNFINPLNMSRDENAFLAEIFRKMILKSRGFYLRAGENEVIVTDKQGKVCIYLLRLMHDVLCAYSQRKKHYRYYVFNQKKSVSPNIFAVQGAFASSVDGRALYQTKENLFILMHYHQNSPVARSVTNDFLRKLTQRRRNAMQAYEWSDGSQVTPLVFPVQSLDIVSKRFNRMIANRVDALLSVRHAKIGAPSDLYLMPDTHAAFLQALVKLAESKQFELNINDNALIKAVIKKLRMTALINAEAMDSSANVLQCVIQHYHKLLHRLWALYCAGIGLSHEYSQLISNPNSVLQHLDAFSGVAKDELSGAEDLAEGDVDVALLPSKLLENLDQYLKQVSKTISSREPGTVFNIANLTLQFKQHIQTLEHQLRTIKLGFDKEAVRLLGSTDHCRLFKSKHGQDKHGRSNPGVYEQLTRANQQP